MKARVLAVLFWLWLAVMTLHIVAVTVVHGATEGFFAFLIVLGCMLFGAARGFVAAVVQIAWEERKRK